MRCGYFKRISSGESRSWLAPPDATLRINLMEGFDLKTWLDGSLVDEVALFQTDAALLAPDLLALFNPLIPHLKDPTAVSDLLATARIRIPDLSESERAFGLDNHSLLPHLTSSPRLSLDTL